MNYEDYKNFVYLRVMKAISSQTRLNIIKILLKEKIISEEELTTQLEMSKQNISFHISKLKSAHFIDYEKIGKRVVIKLNMDKRYELNYNILTTLKNWFAKKEGNRMNNEKSFIKSILTMGSISNLKNTLSEIDKKSKKNSKKKSKQK